MKLSKDKSSLVYNDFLTLAGIPPQVYDYRLGNRSALEWVIDQYRVTTDKRSGITNDPNRPDDPQYIVRLIGQVVAVSLETVALVNALPELEILDARGADRKPGCYSDSLGIQRESPRPCPPCGPPRGATTSSRRWQRVGGERKARDIPEDLRAPVLPRSRTTTPPPPPPALRRTILPPPPTLNAGGNLGCKVPGSRRDGNPCRGTSLCQRRPTPQARA